MDQSCITFKLLQRGSALRQSTVYARTSGHRIPETYPLNRKKPPKDLCGYSTLTARMTRHSNAVHDQRKIGGSRQGQPPIPPQYAGLP